MNEHVDRRVLGAIRWVDAVTQSVIVQPLRVEAASASLTRNLRGLSVVTAAAGLENYPGTFDLAALLEADAKPDGSVTVQGRVTDPTGTYLPRAFTLKLPRAATPGRTLPVNSIFAPMDLALLPTPQAKVMAGWAQVRVTVRKKKDATVFPQVLVRVVLASDHSQVLGRGMSDARGEALVVVPGLPLFQPGATPELVVTSETAAHVEFIPPAESDSPDSLDSSHAPEVPVDWTELDARAVVPANVRTAPLGLKAGETYSLQFAVTS